MKKILHVALLLLFTVGCTPTRNVYWEIVDAYAFDGNGEKIRDIPAGVPLTICIETKRRTGPLDGPGVPLRGQRTKGRVIPFVFVDDAKKFKGGFDSLSFDVTLGRDGKGYIHDVVIEYEPELFGTEG